MTMMWFLLAVALLHIVFTVCELFPWPSPVLLTMLTKKKLGEGQQWSDSQQRLVATIVHNAGIYNFILAAGLFWFALPSVHNLEAVRFLLAGVAVAGIFGTATIGPSLTALQAALGLIGLVALR